MFDPGALPDLYVTRTAIEDLMPYLDSPSQAVMNVHLVGIGHSIDFIERLGAGPR